MDIGHQYHAPSYALDAIPTAHGWVSKQTGELLIGTKHIDPSLYTKSVTVEVDEDFVPEQEILKIPEAPVEKVKKEKKK